MKYMKKRLFEAIVHNLAFACLSAASVVLLVAAFFVPPMGVIDPSVLAATGILFAFAALGAVYKALDHGVDASITKGDTTLMVGDFDKKQKKDEEDEKPQLLLEEE